STTHSSTHDFTRPATIKKASTQRRMSADRSAMVSPQEGTNRRAQPKRKVPSKGTEPPSKFENPDEKGVKSGQTKKGGKTKEEENKTAWSKKTLTLSCKTLSEEFNNKIKKFIDPKCSTIRSVAKEDKNRYADVLCLDDTRVVLKGRKVDDDYIHANWFKNPDGSKFICTQGPLPETIEDFWLMVFKEKANIVIMLCQFVEVDNEKCAKYFPTEQEESLTFGAFQIKNLNDISSKVSVEGCKGCLLEITFNKKEKHRVRHALMTSWPDQCAPLTSANVLSLWRWQKKNSVKGTPIVIHCSAGVGRTATFAAIELAAARIGKDANLSLMEVVKEMRSMRYQAVQSYVQYLFLHLIMLDLFISEKIIPPYDDNGKFIKDYKKLASRKMTKMAKKDANAATGGKKVSMVEDVPP
ncbi:hypothetical protein PFISCL1PPCAC_7231, partial [Pristionchus fissidentatus]